MRVPDWWAAVLLATAAWRTYQLLVHDDILDWPRRRLLRLGEWKQDGDQIPTNYRASFAEFLKCGYCFGAWCAVAWWGAWQINGHWTLIVATPFALSLGVIALARIYSD